MKTIENVMNTIQSFAGMEPVVTTVNIMIIITAAIAAWLILKQEVNVNGLNAVSNATTANADSYWNRHKGRSAEGQRIKWTRFLFVLFVVEVLIRYIGS